MMDTTSYGVRSAEARSIFCDQSAVYDADCCEVGQC